MSADRKAKAKELWEQGWLIKDIADKLELPKSTVSSWSTRHWNKDKLALKKRKTAKNAEKRKNAEQKKVESDKPQRKKKSGYKGNVNALGHTFANNKSALKHGGFSAVYWDTLSADERAMINDMYTDEETLLEDQIKLLTVRELRIMRAINKVYNPTDDKTQLTIVDVSATKNKKNFKNDADREQYERLRQTKIDEDKISYLYDEETVSTHTANSMQIMITLEETLTKIQKTKTRCIESLATLRKMKSESAGGNADFARAWAESVITAEADIVEVVDNDEQ